MEHLTAPDAQELITENSEFAVNPEVPPAPHLADWANVKEDPIDVAKAGKLLPDAVKLMQEVGWK
jgi:iron(III) transport system substrate-binding protein